MKRRRDGKQFDAFADEAGHTGLNQELFRRLLASVGAPVLHAKELGLLKIDQLIAIPLKRFLEEMDVHFSLPQSLLGRADQVIDP